MSTEAPPKISLPEPVKIALDEFSDRFGLDVQLWTHQNGSGRVQVYPDGAAPHQAGKGEPVVRTVTPRDGPSLELQVRPREGAARPGDPEAVASVLHSVLERMYDFAQEIRFFTFELSERYEEINLLYSISE